MCNAQYDQVWKHIAQYYQLWKHIAQYDQVWKHIAQYDQMRVRGVAGGWKSRGQWTVSPPDIVLLMLTMLTTN